MASSSPLWVVVVWGDHFASRMAKSGVGEVAMGRLCDVG